MITTQLKWCGTNTGITNRLKEQTREPKHKPRIYGHLVYDRVAWEIFVYNNNYLFINYELGKINIYMDKHENGLQIYTI